jgi:hypothetical protein
MTKTILKFAVIVFLVIPAMAFAQNATIDKLFDKYSGTDGFTSVDISAGLFELFAEIDADDPEFEEMQNALKGLKSMRLLAYSLEGEKGNEADREKFMSDIKKTVPFDEFKELMVIKDKDADVNFYAKSNKQIINEMIMIVDGKDEVVLLSLFGEIDLNYMGKFASSMNMTGMHHLGKIGKDHDHN